MDRAGAVRLNAGEVDRLTAAAITQVGEGDHRHDVPAKEYLGKDASVLAQAAGKQVSPDTRLLFGETDEHNPFVPVEQMMPFMPFVRVRDVDEAIAKAKYYEHGFRHTAIIHSNNVRNMTTMGQGAGYDAVRQERTVFLRLGSGRRRLHFVFDCDTDRRGCHDAVDVYARASLFAD